MRDIKESDWKLFKRLRETALERFCERVLGEVAQINSDDSKSKHERYLAIYRLMRERDKEINPIFDYLRRSTAVRQLCRFRGNDLITEQELRQFSPELVGTVEDIVEIYNRPLEIVEGTTFPSRTKIDVETEAADPLPSAAEDRRPSCSAL